MKKFMSVLTVFGVIIGFGLVGCSKKSEQVDEATDKPAVKSPVDGLSKRLPDDVIGFVASSGGDSLNNAFEESLLGQLWDDSEVVTFRKEIRESLSAIDNHNLPEPKEANRTIPTIGGQILTDLEKICNSVGKTISRPFVVGIASKPTNGSTMPIYGFFLVDAGKDKAEITKAIASMETMEKDLDIVVISVGAYTMHSTKDFVDMPVYWGWVDQYFILAVNDKAGLAIKNLLTAGEVDYGARLNKVRGNGDLVAVYLDFQKAGKTLKEYHKSKADKWKKIELVLDGLGLGSAEQFVSRMGFVGPDMVNESLVMMPGNKSGLITCFKPVDRAMMNVVEGRAMIVQLVNFDLRGAYDVILNTITIAGENNTSQTVQDMAENIDKQVGLKIRDELLGSLEGPMAMYAMPVGIDGNVTGGFMMVAELKDAQVFEQSMCKFGAYLESLSSKVIQVSSVKRNGRTVHSWTVISLGMLKIMPTWTIVDEKLILASSSQMCNIGVRQIIAGNKGKVSIRTTEGYKKISNKLPNNLTGLRYSNTVIPMRQARALLQQGWSMLPIVGLPLDLKLPLKFPDAEDAISNMTPMVSYSWIDQTGLHSQSQGPILLEDVVGVFGGGMLAAILMPAMAEAKAQAEEASVQAQIQELDSAVKNYKIDTGQFPDSRNGLNALVQKTKEVKSWGGPYVEGDKIPLDPWGNKYVYQRSGKTRQPYVIFSRGPDGQEGTSDDIYNEK